MPTTPVAQFSVSHTQFLSPEGQESAPIPEHARDAALLQKMYSMMVQTRLFDKKAIALQRTGQLGTYPASTGQEAISVAMGAAMQPNDILCPYYREYGAQFWRGVRMSEVLLYWGGDERGSDFQGPRHDFPFCVPIASQTLHATGAALALQLQQKPQVAVAAIGEGGTSRGDFYESINMAGARKLPAVYVINNNQWAISVPRHAQTACETFAQKAFAAGITGVQVDGNDITAVYDAMHTALAKARCGEGPTVIEAVTYRMCDHTTADDARRYRPEGELEAHQALCPIKRLRAFMANEGWWDEAQEKALYQDCQTRIQAAVTEYLDTPAQRPESMLEYLYDNLPEAYQAQYEALMQE